MAEHNKIGKIGEDLACKYLENLGYRILERNFRVRTGEIDIIVSYGTKENAGNLKNEDFQEKQKNITFVEVKTKKVDSFQNILKDKFAPENNLSFIKRQRLLRAIKHYLSFRNIDESQMDIDCLALIVYLNPKQKQAKVKKYENFVL